MPKAARILSPISVPRIYTEKTAKRSDTAATSAKRSDMSEFIGVALFSGIGLLISLVAVIVGVQGAWF